MSDLSATTAKIERILQVLATLPAGCVVSYAELARRAGFPRGARLAARALAGCGEQGLPWHRVLRADGRIAFAAGSKPFREQVRRLRAEGVTVENGRVRPSARGGDLDALLWAPPR